MRRRQIPPEYAAAMHRIRFAAFPASLCLALAATGCSSPAQNRGAAKDPSTPGAAALPSLVGTEWGCVELTGPDGSSVPVTDQPPTMRIAADGRASGFAGVNRYFTQATFGNSITAVTPLQFGPVGATRMAGPPERMALEAAFTSMLARVRSAQVVGVTDTAAAARAGAGNAGAMLELRSDAGVVARFAPAPADAPTAP